MWSTMQVAGNPETKIRYKVAIVPGLLPYDLAKNDWTAGEYQAWSLIGE